MSQPAVRITQAANGIGTVHIDGHDITHAVYGATIRMLAGEPPQVDLELLPGAVHIDVDAARIVIDDQTRAVLERLGWTPPAGNAR